MTNHLMQWEFEIEGLIHKEIKLNRKIWLKEGELLIEKKGEHLNVFLLGNNQDPFENEQKILPYLKFSSLITSNTPTLKGGGGVSIQSKKEFGKKSKRFLSGELIITWPKEAIEKAEKYAPKFLKQIKDIHDKYEKIIEENKFLQLSIDFFYDSEKKFVYNDEGFISVMISLEALFNESSDNIRYKLAQRAGFLLGLTGFDAVEVIENLKNFYNYRSKLVHGQGLPAYDPDRFKISRYTRYAIIIFCILLMDPIREKIKKKERKKELLLEIDHAMMDTLKRKKIQIEIKRHLKDFILKVPRTFEGTDGHKYRVTAW